MTVALSAPAVTVDLPDICPACLTELPAGYPYDHVEIDQAVAGNRTLFAGMPDEQRAEVVAVALGRGVDLRDLSRLLRWPLPQLKDLANLTTGGEPDPVGRPYMNIELRGFCRFVRLGLVYRTSAGMCMIKAGVNKRCETFLRRAVAAGWVHPDPDPVTGRYRLTPDGVADLDAREAATARPA